MNQVIEKRDGTVAGVGTIKIDSASTATSVGMTTLSSAGVVTESRPHSDEVVESAVYAHLQALRALGQTRVNTADVAKALGIPQSLVDRTLESLLKKGVKVA
jgi:hypothetical protein